MWECLRTGAFVTEERIRVYAAMIGLLGAASLALMWATGGPTTDYFGKPIGTDFSGMWTAGRMLIEGDATGLFDPATHIAYQQRFHANPAIDVYGWHYPPFFLAIAALLALMPYVPALLVWQGTTLALYTLALRAIVPGNRLVIHAALGFPAVFVTLGHGHNAFLTACLIGLGLLWLDRRPILAGILIGLLAYKPQFGLVLPLVLLLGGHWRAFVSAGLTVAVMVVASTLALGPEIWSAFRAGAVFTREVVLEQGSTGWHKIQSTFSAVRALGGSIPLAYGAQALTTAGVLIGLIWLARIRADRRLIAAATATAALLATPYCLDYDMTILGVALAFLAAHARDKGFAPFEVSLMALVWITPLVARGLMQATHLPLGLLVMVTLFGFVLHRAQAARRPIRAEDARASGLPLATTAPV